VLNTPVHGRARTQTGTDINFHQPRAKRVIHKNIETIQLEATRPPLLRLGMDVKHRRLCSYARFYDDFFDAFEQLNKATALP